MKLFALILGLSLCAWAGAQVPGVLIVQVNEKSEIAEVAKRLFQARPVPTPAAPGQRLNAPTFDQAKFESDLVRVPMADITAQEFDDEGRLTPVAWSMADPVFRTAVEEKQVPGIENPTMAQIRDAMGKLKLGYAMVVTAFAESGQIWTRARLFKGNREVWKEEVRSWQSEIQSEFDEENARRSIARTWTQVLAGTALKDLPPRRRIVEARPIPAAAGPNLAPNVAPAPPSNNKQLLIDAMKLMTQKQIAEAILLLRDAVDADPSDPERREALISSLHQIGQPALAAEEARRAANLFPERVAFWVSAARGWLAAGQPAEAAADLNEAVVRDPEGVQTRLLLGEVQVAGLRFDLAGEHLAKALEKSPSPYGHRLAAFAFAAQGRLKELEQELDRAKSLEPKEPDGEALRRFRVCQTAGFQVVASIADSIRSLIPRLRLAAKDPDVRSAHAEALARIQAMIRFFEDQSAPEHRTSTERLLLALQLLNQTVVGLQGSLDKPDEDALTDAAIDLGEAFKALESARKARVEEAG